MPAKLIPDKEVEMMFRRGMTPTEVRAALAESGIHVSGAALSNWRHRNGLPRLRPRYGTFIPWVLRADHRHRWPARMLRLAGRQASGVKLSASAESDLENWLRKLWADDLVVGYSRELPEGWYYHRRRPGVDDGLISNPEVPYR